MRRTWAFCAAGAALFSIAAFSLSTSSSSQSAYDPRRPWLGVVCADLDAKELRQIDEEVRGGCRITDIVAGSPGEEKSLAYGDYIVKLNDTYIRDTNHLHDVLEALPPGDLILLRIWRNDERIFVGVRLDASPLGRIGITLNAIDPRTASARGLPKAAPVVVAVAPGSPGQAADLRAGDILLGLEGTSVSTIPHVFYVLSRDNLGKSITVTYLRDRNIRTALVGLTSLEQQVGGSDATEQQKPK